MGFNAGFVVSLSNRGFLAIGALAAPSIELVEVAVAGAVDVGADPVVVDGTSPALVLENSALATGGLVGLLELLSTSAMDRFVEAAFATGTSFFVADSTLAAGAMGGTGDSVTSD